MDEKVLSFTKPRRKPWKILSLINLGGINCRDCPPQFFVVYNK